MSLIFVFLIKKMKSKKESSTIRGGVRGGDRATRIEELHLCHCRLATAIPRHPNSDRRVAIGKTNAVLDIGDPLVSKNLGLSLRMFGSSNVVGARILGTLVPV